MSNFEKVLGVILAIGIIGAVVALFHSSILEYEVQMECLRTVADWSCSR